MARSPRSDESVSGRSSTDSDLESLMHDKEVAGLKKSTSEISIALRGDTQASFVQRKEIGDTVYAFTAATLVRDYVKIAQGFKNSSPVLRVLRITYACITVILALYLQFFILYAVWNYLCQPQVEAVKKEYSDVEKALYGNEVQKNSYGFWRAAHAGITPSMEGFYSLPEERQISTCQLPFAHRVFSVTMLLVWTLTCVAQIRKTLELCKSLLLYTPTTTLDSCLYEEEDSTTIIGLTAPLKILLTVVVLLPQLLTSVLLNYMGCRWLLATDQLNDFVLNTLALEFVTVLPELLFRTLATKRSMHMTATTFIMDIPLGDLSVNGVIGSLAWLLASVTWVCVYFFRLQQVLPDYQWDIIAVCSQFEADKVKEA
eukprot:TRINITY_DN66900_c0_g1_i1.p1 TRINITY_DN66900_c0_g1~~TRINITY_DN66900_c0_g1_i1.p1  ORF type:complete len:383 (+),score=27.74 TRINITY_DN66900_c0_g1_i1:35-1150(+)